MSGNQLPENDDGTQTFCQREKPSLAQLLAQASWRAKTMEANQAASDRGGYG